MLSRVGRAAFMQRASAVPTVARLELRTCTADARHARKSKISKKEVFDAFVAFDQDKDGFITRDEFRRALLKDCALTPEDVTDLIKEADIDGDGKISYVEFTQVMQSNPAVMKGQMPAEKKVPYDRGYG